MNRRKRTVVEEDSSPRASSSVSFLKRLSRYLINIEIKFKSKKSKLELKVSKSSEAAPHLVTIIHCTSWSVFKRKANEIFLELSQLITDKDFELALNVEGKPKRGNFLSYDIYNSASNLSYLIKP